LPREMIYRRKHGFSLPVSEWLRSDLGSVLEPILLSDVARRREYFRPEVVSQLITDHLSGRADHGRRLWILLLLELWFRMFVDKDLAPEDDLVSVGSRFHPASNQVTSLDT